LRRDGGGGEEKGELLVRREDPLVGRVDPKIEQNLVEDLGLTRSNGEGGGNRLDCVPHHPDLLSERRLKREVSVGDGDLDVLGEGSSSEKPCVRLEGRVSRGQVRRVKEMQKERRRTIKGWSRANEKLVELMR
jgi:hypothetical protein